MIAVVNYVIAAAPSLLNFMIADSPNPGMFSAFNGITALSSSSAWAAGYYFTGTQTLTLIERWNGRSWRQVPSSNR